MMPLTRVIYLLFSLQGRLSRPSYFIGLVLIFVISILFIYLPNQIALPAVDNMGNKLVVLSVTALNLAASLAALMAIIGTHVKRLHDLNFSGWWTLFFFTPLNPIIIILCLFLPGKQQANQYGPPVET